MHDTSIRLNIGLKHSRTRLAIGSALSGTLALTLLAMPGAALAANECGLAPLVAGTVTCTVATNPNANGITYISPPADLTVVLEDGVRIDTTGNPAAGLVLVGDNAFTVNGAVNTIITTDAAGAHGALVLNNTDAISVALDRIVTTGDNAYGILANSAISGPVTVSANRIDTAGANAIGIRAMTNTGAVLVNAGTITTLGANADAISASSAGGLATVNVTGNLSTLGDNSRGVLANGLLGTAVSSNGTITTAGAASTGIDASSASGPVTVTVRNVTTTGAGSQAVLVNAAAGNAVVTVNGALRTTGLAADALTVNSGANAVVNLGAGASLATVQGNFITFNAAGTSTLNTAATIGNNLSGLALVATGGPITINNTGNLTSDIVLTGGADVINNAGTFTVGANPDFGAGFDTFNNSGLVTLLGGATAPVAPVFTGLEAFNNSGTIDLRNGRAGDTLTLPGAYSGAGGTLGLDMAGIGTSTFADQLIIGGAATGTTTIALNQLAGSAPLFNPGTILVNAGTGTSAGAFGLAGGGIDAGFVRYEVGFDPAGNNFVLTGAPSDTAYRTINYSEGIRSLWLKSADAVSAQLRARRDTLWSQGGGDTTGRFWMQFHGSKETRKSQRNFNAFGQSRLTDTGYDQDYFGGQLGLDLSGSSGERGGFAFGLTGGYLNSSLNSAGSADRVVFEVVNAGVYASYSAGNIFFNALGKYDHYWATANTPSANFEQKFSGNVYGARAELGLRFGSDSLFIEPAASISYVKNDTGTLTPLGTSIAFDDDDGLRGRIGGRIGTQFDAGSAKMALYAGANYVHEFKGQDVVTFTGGGQSLSYTNPRLRDYGEATVGMTIAQNTAVSGFFEANYLRSFSTSNGQPSIDGIGGRVGIRFRF